MLVDLQDTDAQGFVRRIGHIDHIDHIDLMAIRDPQNRARFKGEAKRDLAGLLPSCGGRMHRRATAWSVLAGASPQASSGRGRPRAGPARGRQPAAHPVTQRFALTLPLPLPGFARVPASASNSAANSSASLCRGSSQAIGVARSWDSRIFTLALR